MELLSYSIGLMKFQLGNGATGLMKFLPTWEWCDRSGVFFAYENKNRARLETVYQDTRFDPNPRLEAAGGLAVLKNTEVLASCLSKFGALLGPSWGHLGVIRSPPPDCLITRGCINTKNPFQG